MFSHRIEQGICIVNPGAALTLDAPYQFKSFVVDLLEKTPCDGLIVTLEDLNRIDSFGIGVIVGLYKAALQKERPFAVANMSDSHRKLFASTGIDQAIDMYETHGEAISSMRG